VVAAANPKFDYDVLIVGAGPAGSTAAAFARQQGLRVALAEKEAFPRFKIGESLLPHGNHLLRETGVWPKIEAAGFIKKFGAYFYLGSGEAQKEVIFSEGIVRGLDYTYQVERARFDEILRDHAAELGAEILPRTTVRSVEITNDGCRVRVQNGEGEQTLHVGWVIDAGGRDNTFASDLKRSFDPPRLARRIAVYSHFEHVKRAEGREAGHTIVVRLNHGWFWLIPIDAHRTSVGLVTRAEDARAHGGDPAQLFAATVASTPRLRALLEGATPTQPFRVTADYSYFRQQLADRRLILTGDAAGFFDPIFSSGVYVAMNSAKLAIELIARAHREGRTLAPAEEQRYTRVVKAHARVFEKLIHAFYDNDQFAVFMSRRAPLRVDRGITSIVAGHAELPWPVWWRFHLFLFVCRLQKRLRLAAPIAYDPSA
jgi:flavin-dependent dehydrogenase